MKVAAVNGQPKYISVARFCTLMEQAEQAVRDNDLAALNAINAEIERFGYRVIVRNGESRIQQLYYNPATGGYEFPPPKPQEHETP
jgi:hypothetical protein